MSAYYFNSGDLFFAAKAAYERTSGVTSVPRADQSNVLAAILFSAASLEAWIAEIALSGGESGILFGTSDRLMAFSEAMCELENARGSVRVKYFLAKSMLSGTGYDKGARPYKDFHLLFSIRDALMHMRPEKVREGSGDERSRTDKLVQELQARGLCRSSADDAEYAWLRRIATRQVARWACNVAVEMVHSIRDALLAEVPDPVLIGMLTGPFERVDEEPDTAS